MFRFQSYYAIYTQLLLNRPWLTFWDTEGCFRLKTAVSLIFPPSSHGGLKARFAVQGSVGCDKFRLKMTRDKKFKAFSSQIFPYCKLTRDREQYCVLWRKTLLKAALNVYFWTPSVRDQYLPRFNRWSVKISWERRSVSFIYDFKENTFSKKLWQVNDDGLKME